MNRNEDRWRHCYWKEWALIKKRWDELHATWPERAEDGASQTKMKHSPLAVHQHSLIGAGRSV
ncbi:MAG: hypothetical protein ACREXR_15365 [Gammaproteobacteria bacterium]